MKVDIQFVNFPKSAIVKDSMKQRISECVDKFYSNVTSVKAFFSVDGIDHHVKIAVQAGKLSTCINATATDIAHAIDKALQKLEVMLRKLSAKQKHKKSEFSKNVSEFSDYSITNLRYDKRFNQSPENVFDKFETHYISNFEDQQRKVS